MCGIFGHIGGLSSENAKFCINSLSHRGPDGSGLFSRGNITLGHTRLAILDLTETGKQPMSYADGRYWITYNGEIYNFIEIKKELETKGYIFKSNSDTEVILAAFIEWKEGCLKKFNGMWAFAIWDTQSHQLFLSRDRFGKKPLFFSFLKDGFAFASEMKAITPLLHEVRPNLGLVMANEKIFQYEPTDECLIEGISRFPAGHYGWLKNGELSLHRYWCTLDHLIQLPSKYEEQIELLRELFIDACRLRMRSDVAIGTALSGGLDSSSVISTVATISNQEKDVRVCSDWQHAFVATFPGTPLDETKYAKKVADHLGINATFIDIDPIKAIDSQKDFFYLFEEIYITPPIPFMMTYGAMKDHGIKVTLDGHGADELFAGYSFDYINALADCRRNIRLTRSVLNTFYDSYPKDSSQFNLPNKMRFLFQWHFKQTIKTLLKQRPFFIDANHHRYKELDHLSKQLYISTHQTVLPTLLRNYDRYSMSNGVEIRMPFMDHRIVTFAFSLPWKSKIRNGFSKAIIRDAIAPFMPDAITYRKSKIGFNSPIINWMRGPMKTFLMDTIHSSSFKNSNVINPKVVADRINIIFQKSNPLFIDGEKAWTSLSPYLWEQAFLKRVQKENATK